MGKRETECTWESKWNEEIECMCLNKHFSWRNRSLTKRRGGEYLCLFMDESNEPGRLEAPAGK